MKQILLAISLFFAYSASNAQSNIVQGNVGDCHGVALEPGHPVYVSIDSACGEMFWHTTYTDSMGFYTDTVPYLLTSGTTMNVIIITNGPYPTGEQNVLTTTFTSAGNISTGNDFTTSCSDTCFFYFNTSYDSTHTTGNDTMYIYPVISSTDPLATTVTWDYGDGGTGSGVNTVHVYTTSGTFTVCGTIFNPTDSCTATHCQPVTYMYRAGFVLKTMDSTSATGIKEIKKPLDIKVYPNPATNEIYISSASLNLAKSVTLLDISGRVVSTVAVNGTQSTARINVSEIENGTYFVVLSDVNNKRIFTGKVIKQ